jgi:hypothetical protein
LNFFILFYNVLVMTPFQPHKDNIHPITTSFKLNLPFAYTNLFATII